MRKTHDINLAIILGFTGVLAVMLVPGCLNERAGSYLTFCNSNVKNIGTAFEMYATDWSGKYPTSLTQLTPNYLKTLPECDAAGKMSYACASKKVPANLYVCKAAHRDRYRKECTEKLSRLNKRLKGSTTPGRREVCPDSGEDYFFLAEFDTYVIYCEGDYHSRVHVLENHPAYDGVSGLLLGSQPLR